MHCLPREGEARRAARSQTAALAPREPWRLPPFLPLNQPLRQPRPPQPPTTLPSLRPSSQLPVFPPTAQPAPPALCPLSPTTAAAAAACPSSSAAAARATSHPSFPSATASSAARPASPSATVRPSSLSATPFSAAFPGLRAQPPRPMPGASTRYAAPRDDLPPVPLHLRPVPSPTDAFLPSGEWAHLRSFHAAMAGVKMETCDRCRERWFFMEIGRASCRERVF